MSATPSNEQSLIIQARRYSDPVEQARFLDRVCQGDSAKRHRLGRLLQADHQVGKALGRTPPITTHPGQPCHEFFAEKPGDQIGRYKLLEQLGEGGFGCVWMAERVADIRQRVAVKILKEGMDSKEFIARFEQERQALALMDHPNIAKILDAGATPKGRPYFAMELVRGLKITTYCDEHKLPIPERIQLFIQVCQGVHHAHQKGVIHRDLKPGNLLVTEIDGKPVAKIIDFGVAKALQGRLTDQTLFTRFQRMVGTPRYMSPEQAAMTSVDVDTRSDVYSLGVILYELLTGQTPLLAETIATAGEYELRRLIREVDAAPPSQRVGSLTQPDLTSTANFRSTEPATLPRQLRHELDWIVLKCLEKDRQRRYDNPKELSEDLRRHLANEAVVARPPSQLYLLERLIRRHRIAFAATTAIALSLFAGLTASSLLYFHEKEARRRAVTAESNEKILRTTAEKATAEALASESKTRAAAAKSEQIASFLTDMLKGAGPSVALGRDIPVLREILEKTTRRIDADFAAQPALQAELYDVVADVNHDLGRYAEAEAALRKSIAIREKLGNPDDPDLIASVSSLGTALEMQGRLDAAETAFRRALASRRKIHQAPHANITHAIVKLGNLLHDHHKIPEATALFEEALAARDSLMDQQTLERAESIHNLGTLAIKLARYQDAESLHQLALSLRRKLSPTETPAIAGSLSDLAFICHMQLRLPESEKFDREALAINRRILGPEHPDTALTLNNLGVVLHDQRKYPEAESMLREAVAIRRKRLGETHAWTVGSLSLLALTLEYQNQHAAAEALLRPTLAAFGDPPADPASKAQIQHALGKNLLAQKRHDEAEPLLLAAHTTFAALNQESPESYHTRIREVIGQLIALFQATSNPARVGEWQQQLADFNAIHPPPPPPTGK